MPSHEIAEVAEDALRAVVDEGIFALGGQLAVIVDGEVSADVACGRSGNGEILDPENLHNVYCLFKPMVYLLLGYVLEAGGFRPDEPLDNVAALPCWVPADLTYRQLAAHDAALGEPSAFAWMMTPPLARQDLLSQANGTIGPAYSEISGGLIAEHIIECLTGKGASDYCAESLLDPLGTADQVIIDPERAAAARQRVRAPVSGLPIEPLPMLSELLPNHMGDIRLAVGALATMAGMAKLYYAVGKALDGTLQPGLPSPDLLNDLMDDDRHLRHDPVLRRPAKWAAGFMTDVGAQDISQSASPDSFGHTGGLANCAAFYDPGRRTAIALYLNGTGAHRDDFVLPRRQLADIVIDAVSAR